MTLPVPGADWVVGSILPDNDATAKHATQCWPREQEPKLGGAVLMWWTDRPYWAAGRAGAAAVRKHGNMQRSHCSYLSTVDGELIDAELSAIGLTLHMTIRKREPIQRNGVNMMAVFRNSKAAIRWTADPELGPGQPVASQTYQMRQASSPMISQWRSNGSLGTPASPLMKTQTALQTYHKRPMGARQCRRHTLHCWLEPDGSPKEDQ